MNDVVFGDRGATLFCRLVISTLVNVG